MELHFQFFLLSKMDAITPTTRIPNINDNDTTAEMSTWKNSAIILRDTKSKIAATAGRIYFICSTARDIKMYRDLIYTYNNKYIHTYIY